jgi:hypothetical protein
VADSRTQLPPALSILAILLLPGVAGAQTDTQFWGNVTLNWLKGSDTTLELDVEPKILVNAPAGQPDWWNVDVTPAIEYAVRHWVDAVGELATGLTKQTDDDNTFELTTRLGAHFHLFSRDLPTYSSTARSRANGRRGGAWSGAT